MKIGIDIDGVLAELADTLHLWHEKEYNFSRLPPERIDYSLAYHLNCSPDEAVKRFFEFIEAEDFEKIFPVKGAIEAINSLAKRHELYAITARSKPAEEKTFRWIDKNFSVSNFEKIHFIGHADGKTLKKSKGQVCLDLGVELMIEDCLAYAKEVVSKGIKVILFDKPWNQADNLPDNIIRCKSWKEIIKYINNV